MIIVIALTATGTFISVSYSIAYGWRLAKYGMLVFGATFGLFGLATAALILLSYLNSAHSFGIPYLSPWLRWTPGACGATACSGNPGGAP